MFGFSSCCCWASFLSPIYEWLLRHPPEKERGNLCNDWVYCPQNCLGNFNQFHPFSGNSGAPSLARHEMRIDVRPFIQHSVSSEFFLPMALLFLYAAELLQQLHFSDLSKENVILLPFSNSNQRFSASAPSPFVSCNLHLVTDYIFR